MAKKKNNCKTLSKEQKYDRQRLLNAERVKRFRQSMTEEQWEDKREKDRERYKKKKEQNQIKSINELSEREKRKKRRMWKENSKKYRLKKKSEGFVLANTPPLSDDENNDVVAVESVQKRRGRKQVKKAKSKAYRTIKKQDKKIKGLERLVKKYQKRLERRQAEKLKSLDSPSPNRKVNTLIGRERVSPHVKKRLFLGYALEKQLKSIKTKTCPQSKSNQLIQKAIGSKILRRYRVQKYFSKIVSYKFNRHDESNLSYDRKKHLKSASKVDTTDKLLAFYEDDTVSKICPGKKDFRRKGKLKVQRRILLDTLKKLHKRFMEENGCQIAYSTFARARPFWVTHPTAKDRDTCACITHSNIDLMVSGLNSLKALKERSGRDALESVVCSVKRETCMMGQCGTCKGKELSFVQGVADDINVKFYQWRVVKEKRDIKGTEKCIKRMVKQREVIKLGEAKERLKMMMINFKQHVCNLLHQAKHKKKTRENLAGREIMLMIDFSENYTAKYQTEVQSMHFGASKKQITLHTVVCYYNSGEKILPKSFCTVSDHLAHQSFAVWAHLDPVLEHLAKDFPQTSLVHFFSDSPSSQYRNRTNLYLLKKKVVNYFPLLKGVTWNYSEPGHGKGAMDGIGGTIKRCADDLVLHGQDITKSSDFVKSFKDSKITVLEVEAKEVEEMKKSVPQQIAAVSQITKIKQVTFCLEDNKMCGRTLSCSECTYKDKCEHYHLSDISQPVVKGPVVKGPVVKGRVVKRPVVKRPVVKRRVVKGPERQSVKRNKPKLQVDEVWSSDDDSRPYGVLNPSSVPGCSNISSVKKNSLYDTSNIKIGNFLLIRFENDSKTTNKIHQFVGVCQDVDTEIKVMFLKHVNNDKNLFLVNENDISFIPVTQVVAVLPSPSLLLKGNRVFYEFGHAINVF